MITFNTRNKAIDIFWNVIHKASQETAFCYVNNQQHNYTYITHLPVEIFSSSLKLKLLSESSNTSQANHFSLSRVESNHQSTRQNNNMKSWKNPSLKRPVFLFQTLVLSDIPSSDDDTLCSVKKLFLKKNKKK